MKGYYIMDDKLLPLCERVFEENVARILNAKKGQLVMVECMRAAGRVPFDYMDRLITAAMAARAAERALDSRSRLIMPTSCSLKQLHGARTPERAGSLS